MALLEGAKGLWRRCGYSWRPMTLVSWSARCRQYPRTESTCLLLMAQRMRHRRTVAKAFLDMQESDIDISSRGFHPFSFWTREVELFISQCGILPQPSLQEYQCQWYYIQRVDLASRDQQASVVRLHGDADQVSPPGIAESL